MSFHKRMMDIQMDSMAVGDAQRDIGNNITKAYKMGHRAACRAAAKIAEEMDRIMADNRATFEEGDQRIRDLEAENVALKAKVAKLDAMIYERDGGTW